MTSAEAYAVHGLMFVSNGLILTVKGMKRQRHMHIDAYVRSNAYLEGVIKLTGVGICTFMVVVFGTGMNNPLSTFECIIMCMFVGLSGMTDLMLEKYKQTPLWSRNVMHIVTLLSESLIFGINFKNFSDEDVHLHYCLVLIISFGIICEIAEYTFRQNPTTTVCRGFLALLHGSWLLCLALLRNNPDHSNGISMQVNDVQKRFFVHILLTICLVVIIHQSMHICSKIKFILSRMLAR